MNLKNFKLLVEHLEKQLDSPSSARFNMLYFGNPFSVSKQGVLQPPVCNTQACLAGETVLSTGTGRLKQSGGIEIAFGRFEFNTGNFIQDQAIKDLGLTKAQSERLFFFSSMLIGHGAKKGGWPHKFEYEYRNAQTPQGRLYVAIRRVEHFVKTKGRE